MPKARRRGVFGRDPQAYDRARLPYPTRVYDLLERRCGLGSRTAVLEIGPGTGIASRELLRRGAASLTLVEVDRRLVRFLRNRLAGAGGGVRVVHSSFERARLGPGSIDLVVAASSFHWLPPRPALRKVARVLRPGGWWAAWNNQHGDPSRRSEFHRELQAVYDALAGRPPSNDEEQRTRLRAQDRREAVRRLDAVAAVGAFDRIGRTELRWTARLPAPRVVALWASFSEIATLPPPRRRRFLRALDRVVRDRFGGEITLPIVTPVFTARRN